MAKAGDLAAILTNLEPRDVLFIDEIHRLPANVEEILYPAMEDHTLDLIIGEGPSARSMKHRPAALHAGRRPRRVRGSWPRRCATVSAFPSASNSTRAEELGSILRRRRHEDRRQHGTQDGAEEIAGRSRGTPRIAVRLLRRVRDFCRGRRREDRPQGRRYVACAPRGG
jgi:Holliday junction DNA helicase RuvB